MKLALIQTLVAVAELRHFGRAAQRLNTTQSNVSARIAELERLVGGRLFTRESRSVALTPLGREVLEPALEVLRALEDFSARVAVDLSAEGTLRLALSETVVTTVLPRFIEMFTARFPHAALDLTVDSTTNQRALLLERSVDLAFLMGPVSDYRVVNLPLVSLPLIWVAAPDHEAARTSPLDPATLARWPVISYASNSRPFAELAAAFADLRLRPRFFASNSLNASLAMTLSGLGISTLPEIFARPHIARGALVPLATAMPLGDLTFTASFIDDPMNGLARAAARLAAAAGQATSASPDPIDELQI